MEDYQLDIMIGEGPAARSIKLEPAALHAGRRHDARGPADLAAARPLRHRAAPRVLRRRGPRAHRDALGRRSSTCRSTADGARRIAQRSRGTPRIANRLLRRVRDYAQVQGRRAHRRARSPTPRSICSRSIRQGFDTLDRKLLLTIIEKFDGGPVGIDSLAAAIGEERGTLEDVIEPFLIQQGFLVRTARGRMVTRASYLHFGLKPPERAARQPAAVRGRRGERRSPGRRASTGRTPTAAASSTTRTTCASSSGRAPSGCASLGHSQQELAREPGIRVRGGRA